MVMVILTTSNQLQTNFKCSIDFHVCSELLIIPKDRYAEREIQDPFTFNEHELDSSTIAT